MNKCKITVLKRCFEPELIEAFLHDNYLRAGFRQCDLFEDGQEFLVTDPNLMPEGFCAWAWVDIHRELVALMSGGNLDWMKESGTALTCCTDGFRPVIFHLKRIED